MAAPVAVDTQTFPAEVQKATGLVIVDFWAPWCGPCRIIGPVLEEIAKEQAATVKVAKVNVDENQQLAGQFSIMSIPTLLFFKDGKVVEQIVGAVPKDKILQTIERHSS
jgi:thioredoxin 1